MDSSVLLRYSFADPDCNAKPVARSGGVREPILGIGVEPRGAGLTAPGYQNLLAHPVANLPRRASYPPVLASSRARTDAIGDSLARVESMVPPLQGKMRQHSVAVFRGNRGGSGGWESDY